MEERIEINEKQMKYLTANLIITKMLFTYPRTLFKTSGNAAWLQIIYMTFIALLLLEASFALYKYSGNRSVLQLAEIIGKKPLKIIVAFLVLAVIITNVAIGMRAFPESVKIILLPKTPIEYVMVIFAAVVAAGAFYGLGTLSVVNALFFPFFAATVAVLFLSLIPYYKPMNIMPFFGIGAKNVFFVGLRDLSVFSDILVINLLMPYCKDMNIVKKGGKKGLLWAGVLSCIIVLAYGMCYPYPKSKEFLLTMYQLSRMVRAGEYFQRFEAFFEFVWTLTQLLYMSIYVFVISDVIKTTFKLKYSKMIIPCIAIIIMMLAFVPASLNDTVNLSEDARRGVFVIAYLLPIIMPFWYMIKGRTKNEGK